MPQFKSQLGQDFPRDSMYIHLNKKITVPNCNKVRTISWSSDHEFIACGGENGVLKVIKLEANLNSLNKGDNARNFSHNQTLESHKTTVQHVCWNEPFQKLTSSDDAGSIIVWMLYKGMWYEEMVNNRNKSLVTGMAWTFDGQKICIVYDGKCQPCDAEMSSSYEHFLQMGPLLRGLSMEIVFGEKI